MLPVEVIGWWMIPQFWGATSSLPPAFDLLCLLLALGCSDSSEWPEVITTASWLSLFSGNSKNKVACVWIQPWGLVGYLPNSVEDATVLSTCVILLWVHNKRVTYVTEVRVFGRALIKSLYPIISYWMCGLPDRWILWLFSGRFFIFIVYIVWSYIWSWS